MSESYAVDAVTRDLGRDVCPICADKGEALCHNCKGWGCGDCGGEGVTACVCPIGEKRPAVVLPPDRQAGPARARGGEG